MHIVLNVLEEMGVSCSVRKTGCWMRSSSASESDSYHHSSGQQSLISTWILKWCRSCLLCLTQSMLVCRKVNVIEAVVLFPISAASERRAKSRLTDNKMLSIRRLCHVLLHMVHQPNQEVSTSPCPKSAHRELHLVQVLGSPRA